MESLNKSDSAVHQDQTAQGLFISSCLMHPSIEKYNCVNIYCDDSITEYDGSIFGLITVIQRKLNTIQNYYHVLSYYRHCSYNIYRSLSNLPAALEIPGRNINVRKYYDQGDHIIFC